MKNLLFVLTTIFLFSCQKEKVKLKDIRQTDISGNIIQESNDGQWGLQNFASAEGDDYNILFGLEYPLTRYFTANWIDLDAYNFNCPTEDILFDFIVYPNPVDLAETENKIFYTFNTDLDITESYAVVVNDGSIVTASGFGSNLTSGYFHPNYGKNFIYYYAFLTADSCAYFGSGKIKIKK